jgi:integrase/recombinase XerD
MPYQYVREPLTAEESDRRSNACETPTERLVVWTLLDTGLCVSELCDLTPKNVLWQQRQLRFKGKGGPHGKKTKVRVVPMSSRVRAGAPGARLRAGEGVPCQDAARPGHRQGGGQPSGDYR